MANVPAMYDHAAKRYMLVIMCRCESGEEYPDSEIVYARNSRELEREKARVLRRFPKEEDARIDAVEEID